MKEANSVHIQSRDRKGAGNAYSRSLTVAALNAEG
jgi:hypothetical protein